MNDRLYDIAMEYTCVNIIYKEHDAIADAMCIISRKYPECHERFMHMLYLADVNHEEGWKDFIFYKVKTSVRGTYFLKLYDRLGMQRTRELYELAKKDLAVDFEVEYNEGGYIQKARHAETLEGSSGKCYAETVEGALASIKPLPQDIFLEALEKASKFGVKWALEHMRPARSA